MSARVAKATVPRRNPAATASTFTGTTSAAAAVASAQRPGTKTTTATSSGGGNNRGNKKTNNKKKKPSRLKRLIVQERVLRWTEAQRRALLDVDKLQRGILHKQQHVQQLVQQFTVESECVTASIALTESGGDDDEDSDDVDDAQEPSSPSSSS